MLNVLESVNVQRVDQGVTQAAFEIGIRFWAYENWRPNLNQL